MSELNDCDTRFEPKGAANPLEDREHDAELWAKKVTEVPSNMKMRGVYDASDNPIYLGFAVRGLSESADGWLLYKLQYDSRNNCVLRDIGYDSWDNVLTASYS